MLSVATSDAGGGSRRIEASLASDGRWWCYRSVVGPRGGEEKLPAKKTLALKDAAARLGRILAGTGPDTANEDRTVASRRTDRTEMSVEAAWRGDTRGPVRPRSQWDAVIDRFGAEMQALSPACATARLAGTR